MGSVSPSAKTDVRNSFQERIIACYDLGERISTNRPFLNRLVRRYHRYETRQRKESSSYALPLNQSFSNLKLTPASASSLDTSRTAVHHPLSHSWPNRVALCSDDKNISWSVVLHSQHCPFCKPFAHCDNIEQLLLHLELFHREFTFDPNHSQNQCTIVMNLRANDEHQHRYDSTLLTGAEGCLLSSRMRVKFPHYCDAPEPNGQDYPFKVLFPRVATQHQLALALAPPIQPPPAITDARSNGKSHVNLFSSTPPVSPLTLGGNCKPSTRKEHLTCTHFKVNTSDSSTSAGSPESEASKPPPEATQKPTPTTNHRRNPRRRAKLATEIMGYNDEQVRLSAEKEAVQRMRRLSEYNKSKAKEKTSKPKSTKPTSKKRCAQRNTTGMNNEHTIHFRQKMFGKRARSHNAGSERNPRLSPEAADGRLFHSSLNIPIDTQTYNGGLDSDVEDTSEKAWRLRHGDNLLFEFTDLEPNEKYFLALWNQFVNQERAVRDDREVFPMLLDFVAKFGTEVARMKLEAYFSALVTHMWKLALLDSNGVIAALRAFRDLEKDVTAGVPHKDFNLARTLTRENDAPHLQPVNYTGLRNISKTFRLNVEMVGWVDEQLGKVQSQSSAYKMCTKSIEIADNWMENVQIDEQTELDDDQSGRRQQLYA